MTGDFDSPYQSARYWYSKNNKKESPVFSVYNQLYEDQLSVEGIKTHFDIWVKQLEALLSAHNTIKIGFLQSEFSDPRDASKKPTFSWIYVFEQDENFTSDDIVYNLNQEIKKLRQENEKLKKEVEKYQGKTSESEIFNENKELKKENEKLKEKLKSFEDIDQAYVAEQEARMSAEKENEELKKQIEKYLKLKKPLEETYKGFTKGELILKVENYMNEQDKESDHFKRWKLALDVLTGGKYSKVLEDTAKENVAKGWKRWEPILEFLEKNK